MFNAASCLTLNLRGAVDGSLKGFPQHAGSVIFFPAVRAPSVSVKQQNSATLAQLCGRCRVTIEAVTPQIDGGRFPIKRVPGEEIRVEADIFCDGHDTLSAVLIVQFLRRKRLLPRKSSVTDNQVLCACLKFLSASKAQFLLINLEDLWSETVPQNTPGTTSERRNWSHRARLSLEQIKASQHCRAILAEIDRLRQSGHARSSRTPHRLARKAFRAANTPSSRPSKTSPRAG